MSTTTTEPQSTEAQATKPRGRKPEDHKQSTAREELEARRERDELLADMPELTSPARLRMRHRANLTDIVLSSEFLTGRGERELDPANALDFEEIKQIGLLCADIDEFAESIAVDKEAYAEWSGGKGYSYFLAILARYQEAVGE